MNATEIEYSFFPAWDQVIKDAVSALAKEGVETFESAEVSGNGQASPEPTIRFHGDAAEGFRVLSVAMRLGLRVLELRRVWPILDGEPASPSWEITFAASKAK